MQFSENKPIYLQIADGIMDEIAREAYPGEGRLPSVREYASKVEVNPNTVMRSYDWLQQQGVIFNKRGIGFFLSPEATERVRQMRREFFFKEEADYFFRRLSSFGMTPEELSSLYESYRKEHSE